MARASAFQAEGRRFEPGFPLHFNVYTLILLFRGVAPMVERRSPKPFVVGSSPSSPATNFWKRKKMDKITKFIKDARIEIEKVIFPTKNEIKQSFLSVFVVVTVVSLFLSIIDLVMSSVLKSVL